MYLCLDVELMKKGNSRYILEFIIDDSSFCLPLNQYFNASENTMMA